MKATHKKNIAKALNATCQHNSILLVEEDFTSDSILKQALIECGYTICKHVSSSINLAESIAQYKPTLLVLSINEPAQQDLRELTNISQLSPLPVIIFAKKDSPTTMQKTIKAGVSGYVVNDMQPHRVKSIISVARERFDEYQALRNELEQAKAQLLTRKLVERAKGLIMQQKNISENAAYEELRTMAMNNGHTLAIVAKNVIEVWHLLKVKK